MNCNFLQVVYKAFYYCCYIIFGKNFLTITKVENHFVICLPTIYIQQQLLLNIYFRNTFSTVFKIKAPFFKIVYALIDFSKIIKTYIWIIKINVFWLCYVSPHTISYTISRYSSALFLYRFNLTSYISILNGM